MYARFIGIVTLLALPVLCSSTLAADDPKPRTWTDATGSFTVEAVFVDLSDGKVRLKKTDGRVITVELEKLSSADQQVVRSLSKQKKEGTDESVKVSQLTGKAVELKRDDGNAAGKKSFPRGIASSFESPGDDYYLTSVRIHGSRYGTTRAPKEDFHVSLCDKDFKLIADFKFPYSKVERGNPGWIDLRVKPTKVPTEFVICLNFNPTSTKGVFVSHDAEGSSLVGLPGKKAGSFTGGDWMLRANVDRLKGE
jgi:hypothetical protein